MGASRIHLLHPSHSYLLRLLCLQVDSHLPCHRLPVPLRECFRIAREWLLIICSFPPPGFPPAAFPPGFSPALPAATSPYPPTGAPPPAQAPAASTPGGVSVQPSKDGVIWPDFENSPVSQPSCRPIADNDRQRNALNNRDTATLHPSQTQWQDRSGKQLPTFCRLSIVPMQIHSTKASEQATIPVLARRSLLYACRPPDLSTNGDKS